MYVYEGVRVMYYVDTHTIVCANPWGLGVPAYVCVQARVCTCVCVDL